MLVAAIVLSGCAARTERRVAEDLADTELFHLLRDNFKPTDDPSFSTPSETIMGPALPQIDVYWT